VSSGCVRARVPLEHAPEKHTDSLGCQQPVRKPRTANSRGRHKGNAIPLRVYFLLKVKQWPIIKSVHARSPNHERYGMSFYSRKADRVGPRIAAVAGLRAYRGVDSGITSRGGRKGYML
jgi:hypothetical protein